MIGEMNVELLQGDCLVESKKIKSGSVDLILTDLPYGTMNGFNGIDWDFAIDPKKVYEIASRILRKNGKMVLFSQEPYTTELIKKSIVSLPFSYRAIWGKDNFANALLCNKAMVGMFEDIVIFQNKCPNKENCIATEAFQEVIDKYGFNYIAEVMYKEGRYKNIASARKNLSKKKCNDGTEKDYDNFLDEKMFLFLEHDIKIPFSWQWYHGEVEKYKLKYASTFNLWEGNKYKSNILEYKKDYQGLHPTQKPVALLEDLIKTFSNEGDLIVDLTMGSGSTGVACVNTNRNFIGIEMDDEYFGKAKERLEAQEKMLDLEYSYKKEITEAEENGQLSIFNYDLT